MFLKINMIFVFLSLVVSTLFANTVDERYPVDKGINNHSEVEFISPEKIMLSYYTAVDRGDFVVFGIRLERSMLIPVHVNYIYPVTSPIPRIKVYSRLKKPLIIPEQGNNKFTAVCAVIDMFGNIIETEAHIFLQ